MFETADLDSATGLMEFYLCYFFHNVKREIGLCP